MKFFFLTLILSILRIDHLDAQIPIDSLIGKWRLTALQGKEISNSELKKRYHFTPKGELIYTNHKVTVNGKFTFEAQTGILFWLAQDKDSVSFHLALQPDGTMIIKQINHTGAPGILTKEK
jgi:hypothetical protein